MNKSTLIKDLRKVCDGIAINKDLNEQVAQYCFDHYLVPLAHTKDLISDRIVLDGISDEELFFLAEGVEEITHKILVSDYFMPDELNLYQEKHYRENYLEETIVIPCVEIIDLPQKKQWIGHIDAQMLWRLNKANKINYNPSKQRVLTKIINGDSVEFKNTLIARSVNQIQELMEKGEYIPDDITLDFPEECVSKYKYNSAMSQLEIESLEHFDITDGYHRFKAILQCIDKDPTFNYPMEVRVTAFSAQRTRQFIYQKDQKNKMSRSDSKSMDTFRPSNEIVTRLNERGNGCLFSGMITRDKNSRVDFVALSDIIERYWFRTGRKHYNNIELINISNEVKEILNRIANADTDYFNRKHLSLKHIVILFWLIKEKEKSPEEAVQLLQQKEASGALDEIKYFRIRKPLYDSLNVIFREEV